MLHSIPELAALPGPVHLAIGVFDGVHVGHQAVIRSAMDRQGTPVVVTFDPHPARVVRPGPHPLMLSSMRHRLEIFRCYGVAQALVIPFDEAFARLPAGEFAARLQAACRPLGSISVGSDWTFGHRAQGDVALLRALGITVHAIEPVLVDGVAARSTRVRDAVAAGDFAQAARLLGRPHTVLGRVVEGRQLGRQLGFPTANLGLENEQLPPDGVYAVRARLGETWLGGVANLGLRPSVETGAAARRLEVHLFDFSEAIYGCDLEIEFAALLRPEEKFSSLEALKEQIARDAAAAREVLCAG